MFETQKAFSGRRRILPFLLAAAVAAAAGTAFAGQLIDGGKPQPAQIEGYDEAQCVSLPSEVRVCKARKIEAEFGNGKFIVIRNSQPLGNIDASTIQSSTELFSAFYGDLDNNNSAELIVVDFDGSSNGMGVRYHTINIFRDFEKNNFREPLSVLTNDFGRGTFVYDKARNETTILLTEWRDYDRLDQKPGMYLIGRFYRYKDGRLAPALDKPILARRLSNTLDEQRIKDLNADQPSIPYNWLTAPATKKLIIDPEFSIATPPKNIERGTIEKVETITENYSPDSDSAAPKSVPIKTTQMLVKTTSGKLRTIVLKRDSSNVALPEGGSLDLPSDRTKIFIDRFGLLPRKIAFASGVGLTDYFSAAQLANLRGVKITLITENSNPADSNLRQVWLTLK